MTNTDWATASGDVTAQTTTYRLHPWMNEDQPVGW